MYRIEIWRYHRMVDEYENIDINKVLEWYEEKWKLSYDYGQCTFYVFLDKQELSFEEENKMGFYNFRRY